MHLGIIGYGNIATTLTQLLEAEPVQEITVLVRSSSLERANEQLRSSGAAKSIVVTADLATLIAARPDVVVECAGQDAVVRLAPRVLRAGIPLILVSIGALADDDAHAALRQAATGGNTQLTLPAGAIGGIDLLSALAPAGNLVVTYRGTKPPAAWKGTPAEDILDLDALSEPTVFFSGSARAAARSYPKNANVAATLALAGAGLDATRVELVADPTAKGNRHTYEVRSPLCQYSMEIENAASGGNVKTSVATVYSVLREINRLRKPVVV
jgi:aspartate dehydrogenase